MNKQREQKEIWIGLAKVKQNNRDGVLGDADEAYTNAIALAKSKVDFRSQVKLAVENLGLQLPRLESAEPLKVRLSKFTVHKDLIALAKDVEKDGQVAFGVFYSFDEEE